MKLLAAIFAIFLGSIVTNARAADGVVPFQGGQYAILEGGVNAVKPADIYDSYIPATTRTKFKADWAISGAYGYKWSNGIRAELELSYHDNNFRNFSTTTFNGPLTGHQATAGAMVNVLYDIKTGTRFTPFVGFGVGANILWWRNLRQNNTLLIYDENSTRIALQAIAGLAVALAPQWEAIIDARYRGSNGHRLTQSTTTTVFSNYNLRETTAMIGLRYAF